MIWFDHPDPALSERSALRQASGRVQEGSQLFLKASLDRLPACTTILYFPENRCEGVKHL